MIALPVVAATLQAGGSASLRRKHAEGSLRTTIPPGAT